jgi:hypothetical protein
MKKCSKCGEERPETSEYFPKHPSGINGLSAQCKQCVAAYKRQWCKDNVEKKRAAQKRWRDSNRKKDMESHKIWHENNPGKANEYYRKYRRNNPDVRAASCKKYVENHPVERSASNRKWAQNNPDKIRVKVERRRTKKKQLPSTLTSEQWEITKAHFDNRCCYCGEDKPLTQEHFIALQELGEHSHANIIPACRSCNCSKGPRDFFLWYPKYKHYSKERERKILKFLNYKSKAQQLTFAL